jgi:hypothetical protein
MDDEERAKKQKIKIELFKECFKYIKENFTSWDYRFDDPWYKEIHKDQDDKKKEELFSWKNLQNLPPEEKGIYLFNSRTKFEHPYDKSGIYYIGKASSGLKDRLKRKLNADYKSKYDKNKYRRINFNENVNHYYPYLNYYQKFTTTIWCKIIKEDMVPYVEEILISAFFTKMGNRPPSNRTGPNQLIWTDSENSKELINVYDELLSSEILG